MPRVLTACFLAGCLLEPTLVSMAPDYGYVDGCFDVTIQGSRLGTKATGDIGGSPFLSLVPHEDEKGVPDHATDEGFVYYGVAPPSPSGAPGWFDVNLKTEGENLSLKDYIYYASCPGAPHIDTGDLVTDEYYYYGYAPQVDVGATLTFIGCNLTTDLSLQIWSASDGTGTLLETIALTEQCLTAQVTATLPATLTDGTYGWQLVDGAGAVVYQNCQMVPDTANDTNLEDTAVPMMEVCNPYPVIIGAAGTTTGGT